MSSHTKALRYVQYLWKDEEADSLDGLDRLVYRSNKLGEDLTLTNTGGGNTSSKLIERDPQVIILGVNPFYSPTPSAVAARPGWDVMTAGKDDMIRPVNDNEITRPGPRLAAGLRALASAIWPDISI